MGTLTNVATVSGGGAGAASTTEAEGRTTITRATPFGINTFTTSLLNEEGNAETQAGGHPFEYTTTLVFNYATWFQGQAVPVDGGPKELQTELPPGLVGDLQNTPRCPLELLHGTRCPESTEVGLIHVSLSASIIGGNVKEFEPPFRGLNLNSAVYNMQPTPGHVAALGLSILGGTPIVLEGTVRSDRDYGVTITSDAPTEPALGGAIVTICEHGVARLGSGENSEFVCIKNVPAHSTPFLSNPTACAATPPVTTARVDPWIEPRGVLPSYVSMGAFANAASGPYSEAERPTQGTPVSGSLVTGCDKLHFNPQLELTPSAPSEGGSTQADEPTGIALNLKVPQTDEAQTPATPALKNLTMKFPLGMTASPAAADGLEACTNAQFGLGTEFGPGVANPVEPANPAHCPLASQIGTVEVFTPLLSGQPEIEGVLEASHGLKCTPGMWSGNPALSYQWLRNGKAIEGQTGREYSAAPGDELTAIQCQVTATDAGGSSVAVSQAAVAVKATQPLAPARLGPPSGTRRWARRSPAPRGKDSRPPPSAGCAPARRSPGPSGELHAHLRRRRPGHPVPGHGHQRGRQDGRRQRRCDRRARALHHPTAAGRRRAGADVRGSAGMLAVQQRRRGRRQGCSLCSSSCATKRPV